MERYKLRVKVGQAEFDADGPEAIVKDQFDLFMGCLASSKKLAGVTVAELDEDLEAPAQEVGKNRPEKSTSNGTIRSQEILDRIFAHDGDGGVSLRLLPESENRAADAILLILYGFRALGDRVQVQTTELTQAAKQSGVYVRRISNAIAPCREYVTTGGNRKNARYGLNNRGIAKAEEMLEKMFE